MEESLVKMREWVKSWNPPREEPGPAEPVRESMIDGVVLMRPAPQPWNAGITPGYAEEAKQDEDGNVDLSVVFDRLGRLERRLDRLAWIGDDIKAIRQQLDQVMPSVGSPAADLEKATKAYDKVVELAAKVRLIEARLK